MLIGYARVSSVAESLDVQKEALDRAGVDRLWVDVDGAGRAKAKRPHLEQALAQLRPGDTLVVWRLDRLARRARHLVETVEDLERRGIGVRALAENIDTTTRMGKLMFHVLGRALAEVERNLARERTAIGRAAARARGRRGGRKPKLDEQQQAQAVALYYTQGLPVEDICARLQIAPRTLFRCLRRGNTRKARRKPKTTTAAGRATDQRHKVHEHAPNPGVHPTHHPAVASPRRVATARSHPLSRVPANGTAAQPPGSCRASRRSARCAPRPGQGGG